MIEATDSSILTRLIWDLADHDNHHEEVLRRYDKFKLIRPSPEGMQTECQRSCERATHTDGVTQFLLANARAAAEIAAADEEDGPDKESLTAYLEALIGFTLISVVGAMVQARKEGITDDL